MVASEVHRRQGVRSGSRSLVPDPVPGVPLSSPGVRGWGWGVEVGFQNRVGPTCLVYVFLSKT